MAETTPPPAPPPGQDLAAKVIEKLLTPLAINIVGALIISLVLSYVGAQKQIAAPLVILTIVVVSLFMLGGSTLAYFFIYCPLGRSTPRATATFFAVLSVLAVTGTAIVVNVILWQDMSRASRELKTMAESRRILPDSHYLRDAAKQASSTYEKLRPEYLNTQFDVTSLDIDFTVDGKDGIVERRIRGKSSVSRTHRTVTLKSIRFSDSSALPRAGYTVVAMERAGKGYSAHCEPEFAELSGHGGLRVYEVSAAIPVMSNGTIDVSEVTRWPNAVPRNHGDAFFSDLQAFRNLTGSLRVRLLADAPVLPQFQLVRRHSDRDSIELIPWERVRGLPEAAIANHKLLRGIRYGYELRLESSERDAVLMAAFYKSAELPQLSSGE